MGLMPYTCTRIPSAAHTRTHTHTPTGNALGQQARTDVLPSQESYWVHTPQPMMRLRRCQGGILSCRHLVESLPVGFALLFPLISKVSRQATEYLMQTARPGCTRSSARDVSRTAPPPLRGIPGVCGAGEEQSSCLFERCIDVWLAHSGKNTKRNPITTP